MPLSKVTDTVSGVAGDSILILDQYSVRAQMALQTSQHATTHRASAGFLRTLTTATPHGMGPGEAFMVAGTVWYYRTHGDGYQMLFQVVSVPAPNQVTYYAHTTSDEATTADATGVVYRLGWSRLRVGMRCAIPTTASLSTIQHAFGIGVSQGPYPISSPLCQRFVGTGNSLTAQLGYETGPARIGAGMGVQLTSIKNGAIWSAGDAGTPWPTAVWAAARSSPGLMVIEYRPTLSLPTHSCLLSLTGFTSVAYTSLVTAEHLKSVLRHPENLIVSTPPSLAPTVREVQMSGSSTWDPAFGTFPVYLEAFNRMNTHKLEIMDIGYAFLL